jgi:hypothetical protein
VPPRSPRDLADAILALVNDRSRRYEIGAGGRRRVEEAFSLRRMNRRVRIALRKSRELKAPGAFFRSGGGREWPDWLSQRLAQDHLATVPAQADDNLEQKDSRPH